MASSDSSPSPSPAGASDAAAPTPPGKPLTMGSKLVDTGAKMLQSLKPVKQIKQHACSFALYAHDLSRQIETHRFAARLNQDVVQCAVYDSDEPSARLIGVEYIVSDRIFETLPPEEQKLWHSHAYEIKSGLWVNPGAPEMLQMPELRELTRTYGKFWCTWQVDRGDRLPLGVPALMMSPQGTKLGRVKSELVKKREEKYGIHSELLMEPRLEIEEPEWINPNADYWKQHGVGFAVDAVETEMRRINV